MRIVEDTKTRLGNEICKLEKSLADLHSDSPADQDEKFHYALIYTTQQKLNVTRNLFQALDEDSLETLLQYPKILLAFILTYIRQCKSQWKLRKLNEEFQGLSKIIEQRVQLLKELDELEEKKREAEEMLGS